MKATRLRMGLGVLTLTAASIFATALPATAAPAPSCVSLSQWETSTPVYSKARAYNGCSGTQRYRIIWAWADDTSCYSIGPGGYLDSSRLGKAPYVSEVRAC